MIRKTLLSTFALMIAATMAVRARSRRVTAAMTAMKGKKQISANWWYPVRNLSRILFPANAAV